MKIVIKNVQCPKCGAQEMHPRQDVLLVRGFKVQSKGIWYSQCLVCAGYYDFDLNYSEERGDRNKGWFAEN